MRRIFLWLRKKVLYYLTPEDLRRKTLKKGEALWDKFNTSDVPQATGVKEQDNSRLQMFQKYIASLYKEEREALELWLCYKINYLEKYFCEHTSAKIEEWEQKQKQIYTEHLKIINPNTNIGEDD